MYITIGAGEIFVFQCCCAAWVVCYRHIVLGVGHKVDGKYD